MKHLMKTIGAVLCAGGLLMTGAAATQLAFAAGDIGSLTLHCVKDDVILENLQWELYRVGSREGNTFVPEGEFASYSVIIDDFSPEAMAAFAETYENIALTDPDIDPIRTGATDAQGTLVFDALESGLYLVCGSVLEVDDGYYIPSSLLFEINGENTTMDWDAYPKIEYHTNSELEVIYTVKKVWLNENGELRDPATEITVEIYRDLELYETVVLSDANNWTYEWKDKDYYDFRVIETVIPEGFRVEYESNETQYLIKNIYQPTDTTTSTPQDTTTTETTTLITTATEDERLPQTGQLWWPVILLALGGLVFLAMGCRFLFASREE